MDHPKGQVFLLMVSLGSLKRAIQSHERGFRWASHASWGVRELGIRRDYPAPKFFQVTLRT